LKSYSNPPLLAKMVSEALVILITLNAKKYEWK